MLIANIRLSASFKLRSFAALTSLYHKKLFEFGFLKDESQKIIFLFYKKLS